MKIHYRNIQKFLYLDIIYLLDMFYLINNLLNLCHSLGFIKVKKKSRQAQFKSIYNGVEIFEIAVLYAGSVSFLFICSASK